MIGDIVGIDVLPTSIVRRKAFPNAAAEGRAVGEQSPRDAKAIDELAALVSAVFVYLNDSGVNFDGYRSLTELQAQVSDGLCGGRCLHCRAGHAAGRSDRDLGRRACACSSVAHP